ncbi:MAG: rRNA maturation RNase YbeY [Firmicutes bacterium]|nr:rRNA maturation RNase YbeY [Bacillota bacterium]
MNYEIVDNNLYKDYDYLNDVIKTTLEHENASDAYLSVIFVDNDEIQEINRTYRNIDRVTDVISFALEDNDEKLVGDRILGDIYLCIPRMKEQAKEYNHSEKRELSFLVCHGLLHLLGYDHVNNKEEEKVMFDLQDEILDSLNITR